MEIIGAAGELPDYDRAKYLKAFDDTKAGCKGLVDAGIVKIPRIFIRPPDELAADESLLVSETPVINLGGIENEEQRKEIINEIRRASETWGFCQLVNHGVPRSIMEGMIEGARKFHEQDLEVKKQFYTRDKTKQIQYSSNFDLYTTRAANWRDTLRCHFFSPEPLNPQDLPDTCRDIMVEYTKNILNLGDTLLELLSEAFELKPDHLKGMGCSECFTVGCHYYPACPEPELTLGTSKHSDPSFITVLLQDDIGGLQFLHQHHWVDVKPIPGSLVVNIGDLLQYTPEEDVAICQAYVCISRDSLVGAAQKGDAFWARVHEKFEEIIEENRNNRDPHSINNRFLSVAKDIERYIKCLKHWQRLNRSGFAAKDNVRNAMKQYHNLYNKKWVHDECYEILSVLPKWNLECIDDNTSHHVGTDDTVESSQLPSGVRIRVEDEDPVGGTQTQETQTPNSSSYPQRPPGTKSTIKRARRATSNASSSSASLDKVLDQTSSFYTTYDETQKQRDAVAERATVAVERFVELKTRQEEDRILSMDLNRVPDNVRSYWEERVREILDRRARR